MNRTCLMTLPFHGLLLRGEVSLDAFCGQCAEVGLGHLEPATSLFADGQFSPAQLAEAAARHGLALSAYDALADLGQADGPGREQALASLREDLARCRAMGIPLMMVAGSRMVPGMAPSAARRLVAEGLEALVDEADSAGQTLMLESFGVQPHFHAATEHLAEVLSYADPRVRITFDMGNHLLGGDDPPAVVAGWVARTAHVHVKEFRILGDDEPGGLTSRLGQRCGYVRLDEGDVHATECLRSFEAGGYRGLYSLEMTGQDTFETIAHDLRIVQNSIAKG